MRRRAELYYQQLDALVVLRKQAREELLVEGKKHKAWKLLRSIPALGPIRTAVLSLAELGAMIAQRLTIRTVSRSVDTAIPAIRRLECS